MSSWLSIPTYQSAGKCVTNLSFAPQLSLMFNKLYLKQAGVDEGKLCIVFGMFALPRSPFQVLVLQISCLSLVGKVPADVLRAGAPAYALTLSISLPAV